MLARGTALFGAVLYAFAARCIPYALGPPPCLHFQYRFLHPLSRSSSTLSSHRRALSSRDRLTSISSATRLRRSACDAGTFTLITTSSSPFLFGLPWARNSAMFSSSHTYSLPKRSTEKVYRNYPGKTRLLLGDEKRVFLRVASIAFCKTNCACPRNLRGSKHCILSDKNLRLPRPGGRFVGFAQTPETYHACLPHAIHISI